MNHRLGDLVVKLDWYNRPLAVGILIGMDFEGSSLRILFPNGAFWEYSHDIFPLHDNQIRWMK